MTLRVKKDQDTLKLQWIVRMKISLNLKKTFFFSFQNREEDSTVLLDIKTWDYLKEENGTYPDQARYIGTD